MLKGTVITGANYNQPIGSYYQERIAIGTTKTTGVTKTWSVKTGMHEYSYDRETLKPVIPISKWVAVQFENDNASQGNCVHGWTEEWNIGGNRFTWGSNICGRRTIPAWNAYCADCGQSIMGETYIYLNSDHVAKITSIDCSTGHVIASGCIFCASLEQATEMVTHTCKGASYNRYYVAYNGNSHTSGSTASTTHMYENATEYNGVPISRSTNLATNGYKRSGYVFTGWNTNANGTGTKYSSGQAVKNLTATDGATVTLYAQWVKDDFTLTVNPNSGTWNGSTQTQSFKMTYQAQKSIPVPTRTGYTFSGWTLSGTESKMTTLTSAATFTMGIENATLTAKWTPIQYQVAYNGNGATSGSTAASTHIYDQNKNLTTNGYKRAYTVTYNYNGSGKANTTANANATFNGWATANSNPVKFTDKQVVKNLRNSSGTYNLYANWTLGSVVLPNATRTGYNALGWAASQSATSATYKIGATYTPTANSTLYMVWDPIEYQVAYNGNGATSGSTATSNHTYDQSKNLTTNGYKRAYTVTYNYNGNGTANTTVTANATFNGWATTATGSKTYTDNQSVKNLRNTSGTYNLYANWTLGDVVLPSATRIGYNALGWSTSQSATSATYKIGEKYTPTANSTLYMVWEPIQYQVEYKGNGATSGSTTSSTHTYDKDKNLTTNGYKRNYTVTYNYNGNGMSDTTAIANGIFNGWATANTTPVEYADKQIVKNLRNSSGTYNLYANWTLGSVVLPNATRIGHNALGWDTSQSTTSASYNIGETYTPSENITLYMVWEPYKLKANVSVKDNETKQKIQEDAVLDVYEWNETSNTYTKKTTLTRQTNGEYITQDYLIYTDINQGKFRIIETNAPKGYYGDWKDETQTEKNTYDFNILTIIQNQKYEEQTVTAKGTIDIIIENERQKGNIEVNIVDSETKAGPQGDATLEATQYGLYAKENINHLDGVTGVIHIAKSLIEVQNIKNGQLVFNNLELGLYEIRQIIPSEGYKINNTTYPITISHEGEEIKTIQKQQTVEGIVKKQAIELLKVGGLQTDTTLTPLENAGFKIYLISDLEKVKNGEIVSEANGNYNIQDFISYDFSNDQTALDYTNNTSGEETGEIFTDENGRLTSKELAYGKYIVVETTVPEEHLKMDPFLVDITEDSRITQKLGTFLNKDFTSKIKIVKKDDSSKQTILKANAKYRIYNLNKGEYIEQDVNGNKVGTEQNPYTTDRTGTLTTPIPIRYGEYELQEVGAPEGYVLTGREGSSNQGVYTAKPKNNVQFIISEKSVHEIEQNTNEIVMIVEQYNERQVGSLTINVRGEYLESFTSEENGIEFVYKEKAMKNAMFEIYAKEDIISPEGQNTIIYQKDSKIQTMQTNIDGNIIIDNLPLGSYYIVQTQVDNGFVLKPEQKEINISYIGQTEAVSYVNTQYVNQRQKIKITIENQDSDSKEKLNGGTFGLYAKEEIICEKIDGSTEIIPIGTLIKTATIQENGQFVWDSNENLEIPFGKYQIEQMKAPDTYVKNKNKIEVDLSYQGHSIELIEKTVIFENQTTRVAIRIEDDETKQGLADVEFRLLDESGNEIVSWKTEESGEVILKGLSYGKTYTLEEIKARESYMPILQTENIVGELNRVVDENGNVQFALQEDLENGKITVSNLAKVGNLTIKKQGDVLIGKEEQEDKSITFLYEKQNIANTHFEIYAKEDIRHPDGHTGIIFTKETKIAEGITTTDGLKITHSSEELKQNKSVEIQNLLERGLPLGNYILLETKATEGYYRDPDNCKNDILLEDDKQINELIEKEITIENAIQKVSAKAYKFDMSLNVGIEGVTLGIYTAEDLIKNGNVIVEKDRLLQSKTTNTEGIALWEGDFPLGNYYVKEIEPAKGYIKTEEKMEIDAETLEETVEIFQANITLANQKTKLGILKTTMDGKGIIGAELQIVDEKNEVVEEWISNGYVHQVEGLETQKTYFLQEVNPAKGFVTAKDITFQINSLGEIITDEQNLYMSDVIQMKDAYTEVEISIIDKNTREQIPGITVQVIDKTTGELKVEYNTTEKPQLIIGLTIGEYEIKQVKLPKDKGYVTTNDFMTVKDIEGVQEKIIEQEITKIKLEVKDKEEDTKVDEVKIYIIDKETNEIIASTEEIEGKHKIVETQDGYFVEEIPIGKYILKEIVPYGYEEIKDTEITVEDSKEEQIYETKTRRLKVDIKIEKQISKIIINGKENKINEDNKIPKIEVVASKLKTESIEIEYKIKVTNVGEINANVEKIIEDLPDGFTYDSNQNSQWKLKDGQLICDTYAENPIEVGKTKEITIRLKWNNEENNFGEKVNKVRMEGISNKLGEVDEREENNTSISKAVMSIKTGNNENYQIFYIISIIISTLLVIGICILIEIKVLKRKLI